MGRFSPTSPVLMTRCCSTLHTAVQGPERLPARGIRLLVVLKIGTPKQKGQVLGEMRLSLRRLDVRFRDLCAARTESAAVKLTQCCRPSGEGRRLAVPAVRR